MAATTPQWLVKASRLGGLFALAVLAHLESVSYWFVSTDTFALIRTSRVRSLEDFRAVFTEPLMHGTGFTDVALFYRPLSSLTFAFDYWLWGLNPAGYHATNLVLHGLAVALTAVVVAEVTRRDTAGLLAGGLFAFHPLTAEVVPVVARRQDVVMLVLVLASLALYLRSRRERSAVLYATAVVAYGLALAAKEPALLLPVLVFAWAAIDHGTSEPFPALIDALRSVLPFAAVTLGYLAVRLTVLGGFGGYLERPPLTMGVLPVLVTKYVLSMWYPTNAVGVGATADGAWLVVTVVLAVLAGVMLGWAVPATLHRPAAPRVPALIGLGGGLGVVPVALGLDQPSLQPVLAALGYLGSAAELPFPYPYHGPAGPVIGLGLIGAVLASVLWSVVDSGRPLAADRQALAFFGVWLLLPVGLFYRSGDYAIRSGYPSLVPAMAILAVLLVAGARRVETGLPAAPVLAAAVLLLVVPMVAASPLVHPYDGWSATGEVNRLTLTGLEGELESVRGDAPVEVVGVPNGIRDQQRAFPRVASIGFLGPGSVQAWLGLRSSADERPVTFGENRVLEHQPTGATFETDADEDRVTVRVTYDTDQPPNESPPVEPVAEPRAAVATDQRLASPDGPRASVRLARTRSR